LVLTPMPNAIPNCQLLFSIHVSSREQASIVPETNIDNRMSKRKNTVYKNKTLRIDDMRSLAEFL
jgi:hypothetical protein